MKHIGRVLEDYRFRSRGSAICQHFRELRGRSDHVQDDSGALRRLCLCRGIAVDHVADPGPVDADLLHLGLEAGLSHRLSGCWERHPLHSGNRDQLRTQRSGESDGVTRRAMTGTRLLIEDQVLADLVEYRLRSTTRNPALVSAAAAASYGVPW